MGWLGWTEAETLQTTVTSVEGALDARGDLLSMIFGSGKKPALKGKKGKGQVGAFKAFAARQNGVKKNG